MADISRYVAISDQIAGLTLAVVTSLLMIPKYPLPPRISDAGGFLIRAAAESGVAVHG